MRAFFDLLGDVLARPPGDVMERCTPYIVGISSALILMLAAISWLLAPGY